MKRNYYILIPIFILQVNSYQHFHPVNHQIVAEIKSRTQKWVPAEPDRNPLSKMSIAQIKGLMGAIEDEESEDQTGQQLSIDEQLNFEDSELPLNFDSRENWSNCISGPGFQGLVCASCWAFSSTQMLSDRYCIESDGAVNVTLSVQDLLTCETQSNACHGGNMIKTILYLEDQGVVTDSCKPYESITGIVPGCSLACMDTLEPYNKYYCAKNQSILAFGRVSMATVIREKGPIVGQMHVYGDFLNYAGGIYEQVSYDNYIGMHAIRIIGWGYDDFFKTYYWICVNSWSSNWGDQGYFKIQMGECDVDYVGYACNPALNKEEEILV